MDVKPMMKTWPCVVFCFCFIWLNWVLVVVCQVFIAARRILTAIHGILLVVTCGI